MSVLCPSKVVRIVFALPSAPVANVECVNAHQAQRYVRDLTMDRKSPTVDHAFIATAWINEEFCSHITDFAPGFIEREQEQISAMETWCRRHAVDYFTVSNRAEITFTKISFVKDLRANFPGWGLAEYKAVVDGICGTVVMRFTDWADFTESRFKDYYLDIVGRPESSSMPWAAECPE